MMTDLLIHKCLSACGAFYYKVLYQVEQREEIGIECSSYSGKCWTKIQAWDFGTVGTKVCVGSWQSQLFKGDKYCCAKLLFVILPYPGLVVQYLILRFWVWGLGCKRHVMHVVLYCVWDRAQHKSFLVAWMKESMSEEGRKYYGWRDGVTGNLLCPSVLLCGAVCVSTTVLFACLQCASVSKPLTGERVLVSQKWASPFTWN